MRFVRVGFFSHMGSGWDSLIELREIFHIVSYSSVKICYEVENATQNVSVITSADPSIDIETHTVSGDREEDIYICVIRSYYILHWVWMDGSMEGQTHHPQ